MSSALRRLLPVICLAGLVSPAPAAGPGTAIRDEAHLFRADTITRAEARIAEIQRTYERKLFVHTVASIEPHQKHFFRFLWKAQANRLLEEQAQKRVDEAGVDGIFVVICNDPRSVHVIVRPDDDPEYTPRDGEILRRFLARRLQDDGPDAALLGLIDQVQTELHRRATRGQSRSVISEYILAGLLGGGFVLALVLSLIRYQIRSRVAGTPLREVTAEQAQQVPALLGAMFGCPAAMWIYDKLYPCPPGGSMQPCPEEPPAAEEEPGERLDADGLPLDERAEDAPVSP